MNASRSFAKWNQRLWLIAAAVAAAFVQIPAHAQGQSCESLAALVLPNNTTITGATSFAAGSATVTVLGRSTTLTGTPAFCQVHGITRPGPNSSVNWEVWMPVGAAWNGRFEQIGGGGINGSISATALGGLVTLGLAVAATDGGSTGQSAGFVNNIDRQLDFAERAYPATHDNAIPLITAFYGRPPDKKYFVGCSEGGREALIMAQRYPTYFDGIQAGSPAKNPSHMWTGNNIWLDQVFSDPAKQLSAAQRTLIQNSSTAACADPATGVVADPRQCNWDVSSLYCTGSNTPDTGTCLSATQVSTLQQVFGRYGGAHNPVTGKQTFPGMNPFSGLALLASNPNDAHIGYLGGLYYNNLTWPWQTYNFASDQAALDAMPINARLSAINPDLSAFSANGGKLIMWVGWQDEQIFVWDTVNFFDYMVRHNATLNDGKLIDISFENPEYPYGNTTLASTLNTTMKAIFADASKAAYGRALAATNNTAKLYMAAGLGHCGGGVGAQSFIQNANYGELTQALVNWVENGVSPPDGFPITKRANNSATGAVQFTTLMCSYPKTLVYNGTGDKLSSSSYACQ